MFIWVIIYGEIIWIISYISETMLNIIDNNQNKRTIELIKYLDVMATPNGYYIYMLKLLVNKFPE